MCLGTVIQKSTMDLLLLVQQPDPKKWPLMAFPDIIIYCFKNVNFWQAKEEIALTQLFGCWAIQQTLFVKDKSVLQEHKYLVYLRVVEKKTTRSSQLLSLKQI